MNTINRNAPHRADQHLTALSQWDTEGGAGPLGPEEDMASGDVARTTPDRASAELVLMRVRIIALENLVLALLAGASARQVELASEVAGSIMPRPGFTPHPLALHAATPMNHLITRSGQRAAAPDYKTRHSTQKG